MFDTFREKSDKISSVNASICKKSKFLFVFDLKLFLSVENLSFSISFMNTCKDCICSTFEEILS